MARKMNSRAGKKCHPGCNNCVKRYERNLSQSLRHRALVAYSQDPPSCACCDEDTLEFLAIDHTHGNGAEERKTINAGNFYNWLKQNDYPDGYRILCHNCNSAMGSYGACPHSGMRNKPMTLNKLRDRSHTYAVEAGFWDHDKDAPENVRMAARLALVHSEISEALEELRLPVLDEEHLLEELVDAYIRVADICGYYDMDVDSMARQKGDFNLTRPPMHGKSM